MLEKYTEIWFCTLVAVVLCTVAWIVWLKVLKRRWMLFVPSMLTAMLSIICIFGMLLPGNGIRGFTSLDFLGLFLFASRTFIFTIFGSVFIVILQEILKSKYMKRLSKLNIVLMIVNIILIIGVSFVLVNYFLSQQAKQEKIEETWNLPHAHNVIPAEGYVPDGETAIKIAEAVWFPIYGEGIYDSKPFVAKYIVENDCWYVSGTLPEGIFMGGVPEIMIRKHDGTIVRVTHGK